MSARQGKDKFQVDAEECLEGEADAWEEKITKMLDMLVVLLMTMLVVMLMLEAMMQMHLHHQKSNFSTWVSSSSEDRGAFAGGWDRVRETDLAFHNY